MSPKISVKPGGDEKIKPAEGDAVEKRVDEEPLLPEHFLEARGPRRQDQPKREDHDNGDNQRGNGMMSDPAGKRVAAASAVGPPVIAKSRRHLPPSDAAE